MNPTRKPILEYGINNQIISDFGIYYVHLHADLTYLRTFHFHQEAFLTLKPIN